MPPIANRLLRTLALLACMIGTQALQSAHAAISVIDDSGAPVTLKHPAQRIVSLAPHATELLYAAGGGARVVGAVTYSDYPPPARQIPRVGDSTALDLERIAALKPDLLVVWLHGNAQRQIDKLRQLGIPMFYSEPRRLTDIPGEIERLGQLLGTSAVAARAALQFRSRYDALQRTYAGQAPVSVFFQVWQNPLMTINGSQMVSDVIRLCGGRNVFADLGALVPTVSTEAVLAANPQAMFTATVGATPATRPLADLAMWRRWPQLSAVAHHNLFSIDGDLIDRPGPRVLQGAQIMCRDLDRARQRLAASR